MQEVKIELHGIELIVVGTFEPGEPDTFYCPGFPDSFDIEAVNTEHGDDVFLLIEDEKDEIVTRVLAELWKM